LSSPAPAEIGEEQADALVEPRYGRLKVLVVDGDPLSRASLQRAVHRLGHECRTANDGLDAWEMLQAERADVVLSDWTMPRMDGVELCRQIRAAEGRADQRDQPRRRLSRMVVSLMIHRWNSAHRSSQRLLSALVPLPRSLFAASR
jgi:CheY-like chemotaxis protein